MGCYIKKCERLKNESNYFVNCKYLQLILQPLQTVANVNSRNRQIYLQDLHSEKYEILVNNIDEKMITYFTANYDNDICDNLIELWERDS